MKHAMMLTLLAALFAVAGCGNGSNSRPQTRPADEPPATSRPGELMTAKDGHEHSPPQPAGVGQAEAETRPRVYELSRADDQWRELLTEEQYEVTRARGTEQPFSGEYWKGEYDGVFKCVCCGQPLFHSGTKYQSGSGWPSFYAPIDADRLDERADTRFDMVRTEVVCSRCGAHLGHVFDDAPEQPTGLRYCINSVALKYAPRDPADDPNQD